MEFIHKAGCHRAMLVVLAALALSHHTVAQSCTSTLAQTEGPYYRTPNPETTELRIGSDGPVATVRGRVVDQNCNPLAWTWVAIWHADPTGAYDNTAPFDRYRATMFTDANGEFAFHTIVPGIYPGRTIHIHWKVDGANTAVLTTQTYFPGIPQNATDSLYNPALLMTQTTLPDGSLDDFFQFVVPTSGACTGASITANPAPLSVDLGATAVFTAAGAGSTPRTYRWYRNGIEIVNGPRVSGAYTTSLTITSVEAADAGQYTCRSGNSCGSQLSTAAALTVIGACPADFDGNGQVDAVDLATVLSNWGVCAACTADLDHSGQVDATDLAMLFAGWGACQ